MKYLRTSLTESQLPLKCQVTVTLPFRKRPVTQLQYRYGHVLSLLSFASSFPQNVPRPLTFQLPKPVIQSCLLDSEVGGAERCVHSGHCPARLPRPPVAGSRAVPAGGALQARARHWAKHCSPEGFIWAESSPPSGLPVGRRLLYCLARAAKKGTDPTLVKEDRERPSTKTDW